MRASNDDGLSRRGLLIVAYLLAAVLVPSVRAEDAGCEVRLGSEQIDYGLLSRATLAVGAAGHLVLPTRTVGLHVRCPVPRDMTLLFDGTRADAGAYRFADRGRFALCLRDAVLDGVPVDLGQVDPVTGMPARSARALPWTPGQGIAPLVHGEVAKGLELSAQIDVEAFVEEDALRVSDATRWTTTGTIEVVATGVSRELTLQADARPGRCGVEVIHDVSFGTVQSSDLDSHGASTVVPAIRHGRLRVRCDGAMPVAFRIMRDERAGTAVSPVGLSVSYPEAQLFGLGKTPSGEDIGAYVLRWGASAMSDDGRTTITRSLDGGRTWVAAGDTVTAEHAGVERIAYASPDDAARGPAATTALDVTLDATIFIAPKQRLSLAEPVAADGLATFEIIY